MKGRRPVFKLSKYLRPYKKQLIIGPIFKLLEAIFELLIPTMMVYVIDRGVKNNDRSYIIRMSLIMALIAVLGLGFALVCQYMASVASQGFGTILRNELFDKIQRLSISDFSRFSPASLTNRITNDINVLQQAVAMLIRLVIRAPFISVGSFIMAALLDLKLSLIFLAVMPLISIIIYLIMSKSIPLYRKAQKKLDALSLKVKEYLSGVRVIRAFVRTDYETKRFNELNDEYADNYVRVNKISSMLRPATSLVMNFGILAVIYFGGVRVNSNRMTQGEIIAFINYIVYILNSLIIVANLITLFTRASASGNRVSEVLSAEDSFELSCEEFEDVADPQYAVEFKNVSFSYGGKELALKDINFKLSKGGTLGIIGGTGDGKSTLIYLIIRFYDPTSGSVYIDGKNVKAYPIKELREKIGAALQKTEIFSGTIEENIQMGSAGAQHAQIRQAAKYAQAEEFINAKIDGYNTKIERGGSNLSGGQKQRLSVARALARRPEILILDDSSSALDYATDAALRKAVKEYARDMTTIIVSQRVSSVKHADLILVMNEGEIVDQGRHEDLYGKSEAYMEICESQDYRQEAAM